MQLLQHCEIPTNLARYGLDLLPEIQDYLDTLGIRILYFNEVSRGFLPKNTLVQDRARLCKLLEWAGPTYYADNIPISECNTVFNLLISTNGLFDCFFCLHCLKAEKRGHHR